MPEVKEIPVDKIRPNPFQPREEFDKEKIEELADSIEQEDLIQPILVRKKGKTYQIIAGERRWRAFQFLGEKSIPVVERDASDVEARELSIAENWHRLDLEPQQTENFLAKLYEDGKEEERYENINDMAEKTGIPRKTLESYINAHRERKEQEIGIDATYQDIERTTPLRDEPEFRKKILQKRKEGEIRATDLRDYSKAVKKSSPPVRKALLEGAITPEEAKTIETELTSQEEKERATRSIKRDRSPEKVEFAVDIIKQREERKDLEAGRIERATGDIWKCPVCKKKFRLIHVDPEESHRLEEIED